MSDFSLQSSCTFSCLRSNRSGELWIMQAKVLLETGVVLRTLGSVGLWERLPVLDILRSSLSSCSSFCSIFHGYFHEHSFLLRMQIPIKEYTLFPTQHYSLDFSSAALAMQNWHGTPKEMPAPVGWLRIPPTTLETPPPCLAGSIAGRRTAVGEMAKRFRFPLPGIVFALV
jgi:hypothetical protein